MSVLGGVLLAYLAFFLLTCRAPYSGDEWGPQWLSCARTVRSGASGRRYATHTARTVRSAASGRRHAHCHTAEAARCWAVLPHESHDAASAATLTAPASRAARTVATVARATIRVRVEPQPEGNGCHRCPSHH